MIYENLMILSVVLANACNAAKDAILFYGSRESAEYHGDRYCNIFPESVFWQSHTYKPGAWHWFERIRQLFHGLAIISAMQIVLVDSLYHAIISLLLIGFVMLMSHEFFLKVVFRRKL